MELKGKKILVTGGNGFLGKFVVEELKKRNVTDIFTPSSSELDLRLQESCRNAVKNVDVVFHLAGTVGGIGFNKSNPADCFYDNIMMSTQLIHEAMKANIEKLIALGTVCSYPKFANIPFSEEEIWEGYPEETNAAYGLSKKMMLVQSDAYRQQFGFNSISIVPTNLYGPYDDFNPETSHVIPGIILKIFNAQKLGQEKITLWGNGTPTRDFLFVEDAARGIVLAGEKYEGTSIINLGSEQEISIKDLAETIAQTMNFSGEILWDETKPNGQPRRCVSNKKAKENFGFEAKISMKEGLQKTIEWYVSQNN
jgi:GDP-L-fucose synthase